MTEEIEGGWKRHQSGWVPLPVIADGNNTDGDKGGWDIQMVTILEILG